MIWTQPKQIGPVQNDWYSTKRIWTTQKMFVFVEGQGFHPIQDSHDLDHIRSKVNKRLSLKKG